MTRGRRDDDSYSDDDGISRGSRSSRSPSRSKSRGRSTSKDVKVMTKKRREQSVAKRKEDRIDSWWAFQARYKTSNLPDNLHEDVAPRRSKKLSPYCLTLKKISNWNLPVGFARLQDGQTLQFGMTLSMFHLRSRSVFGNTWIGPEVPSDEELDFTGRDRTSRRKKKNERNRGRGEGKGDESEDELELDKQERQVGDVAYGELLYYISRLDDDTCVGVNQLTASVVESNGMISRRVMCGSAIIPLFGRRALDNEGRAKVYPVSAHTLLARLSTDYEEDLSKMSSNGCSVRYRLESHEPLKSSGASQLIAADGFYGSRQPVPGLELQRVDGREVACFLSRSRDQPCRPLRAPRSPLRLTCLQLRLPARLAAERALLTRVGGVKILSRSVRVGVHNGLRRVSRWTSFRLTPVKEKGGEEQGEGQGKRQQHQLEGGGGGGGEGEGEGEG